uniref:Uncharacterized protein n=1 Tax=Setaria italica TaxID=4555 RepID=K3YNP8_SETIT
MVFFNLCLFDTKLFLSSIIYGPAYCLFVKLLIFLNPHFGPIDQD